MKDYWVVQRAFLKKHPWCEICLTRGRKVRKSTEVHHINGRNGKRLLDTRFFKASCRPCRMWPHENPREARALGLLI